MQCFKYKSLPHSNSISFQERLKFTKCSDDSNGTYSAERSQSREFMNKYLKIDETERKKFGYTAKDFIRSCTFNGDECSVRYAFSVLKF